MNVLYCPQCGAKLEYAVHKPKFCSSCGESLGSTARGAVARVAPEDLAEEDLPESLPNLSKLEYEISVDALLPTIGSVIQDQLSNKPLGADKKNTAVRPPASDAERNKTGDELIKESLAQCKSARKPKEPSE